MGTTPLHVATLFGHTAIIRYLGGRFSETLQARDSSDRTPLHYAATMADNGHYYNLLLNLGADPTLKDNVSLNSYLHLLVSCGSIPQNLISSVIFPILYRFMIPCWTELSVCTHSTYTTFQLIPLCTYVITNSMQHSPWREWNIISWSRNSVHFMEPENHTCLHKSLHLLLILR